MAIYVEQVRYAPNVEKKLASIHGAVVYSLTSGADGTELTGDGEVLVVSTDVSGWCHVSTALASDKAAVSKTHRIIAGTQRAIGGVLQGYFVSFITDS